jgi:hypothetical protein
MSDAKSLEFQELEEENDRNWGKLCETVCLTTHFDKPAQSTLSKQDFMEMSEYISQEPFGTNKDRD